MKLRSLFAIAALSGALAGCAFLQSLPGNGGGTSPPVANSIQMAGDLDVAIVPVADAFVKTDRCARACRDTIAKYSHDIRGYLDAGLDAENRGDNAAVALALKGFNDRYGSLWLFLRGAGVGTP